MYRCCWIFFFVVFHWGQIWGQSFENEIAQIKSYISNRPDSALRFSQEILHKYQDKKRSFRIKNLMGEAYTQLGQYENAVKLHFEALSYYEEQKYPDGIAESLNLLSTVYRRQELIDKIIENSQRVIALQSQVKNQTVVSRAYQEWSIAYLLMGDYSKGLFYAKKALETAEKNTEQEDILYALNLIGLSYARMNQLTEAMLFYEKSLLISTQMEHDDMSAAILDNIGDVLTQQEKFDQAHQYYSQSLTIAQNAKNPLRVLEVYESWVKLFQQQQDFEKTAEYQKLVIELKDSLVSLERSRQLTQMEVLHEVHEKNVQIAQQKLALEQTKRERQYGIAIGLLLLLVGVIVFLAWRRSVQINRQLANKNERIQYQKNEIISQNEELQQTQEELSVQSGNLTRKNKKLEEINYKVSQSIQAARWVQKAILPTEHKMTTFFEDYFVFSMPKDTVSGDFWWVEQQDDKTILALADCTGHGVAGALMTMIGSAILDRIIRLSHIVEPSQILMELNQQIITILQQETTENTDGMDIGVLVISTDNVLFAGAKIDLHFHQHGELGFTKGTRKSIGGTKRLAHNRAFETKVLPADNGSKFYFYSDGYPDQSNPQRESFTRRRIKELLKEVVNYPLKTQKKYIKKTLLEHKGNSEQRDDILFIGIEL